MGGIGSVCLSYVVLGDYIIHGKECKVCKVCKVCNAPFVSLGW